jgi:hypothetical protein
VEKLGILATFGIDADGPQRSISVPNRSLSLVVSEGASVVVFSDRGSDACLKEMAEPDLSMQDPQYWHHKISRLLL